jgi:hypothetical protein
MKIELSICCVIERTTRVSRLAMSVYKLRYFLPESLRTPNRGEALFQAILSSSSIFTLAIHADRSSLQLHAINQSLCLFEGTSIIDSHIDMTTIIQVGDSDSVGRGVLCAGLVWNKTCAMAVRLPDSEPYQEAVPTSYIQQPIVRDNKLRTL